MDTDTTKNTEKKRDKLAKKSEPDGNNSNRKKVEKKGRKLVTPMREQNKKDIREQIEFTKKSHFI